MPGEDNLSERGFKLPRLELRDCAAIGVSRTRAAAAAAVVMRRAMQNRRPSRRQLNTPEHTEPVSTGVRPDERILLNDGVVKTEAEMRIASILKARGVEPLVKIYAGNRSRSFIVGISDIVKSSVLDVLKCQTSEDNYYVMHPQLTQLDPDDFACVREYLVTDEYQPHRLENQSTTRANGGTRYRLDGLHAQDGYWAEAVKGARLWTVAKQLGIKGLEDLVVDKITKAEVFRYDAKVLLNIAKVVFTRPEGNLLEKTTPEPAVRKIEGDPKKQTTNALEEWLIKSLSDRFQAVMCHQASLFFEIANHGASRKRCFRQRVLGRKLEDWGIGGAEVIEDE